MSRNGNGCFPKPSVNKREQNEFTHPYSLHRRRRPEGSAANGYGQVIIRQDKAATGCSGIIPRNAAEGAVTQSCRYSYTISRRSHGIFILFIIIRFFFSRRPAFNREKLVPQRSPMRDETVLFSRSLSRPSTPSIALTTTHNAIPFPRIKIT